MSISKLWLEGCGDWGTIGGCRGCGYSAGPMLDLEQLVDHLYQHWRDRHGGRGPIPAAEWIEDEPVTDACCVSGCGRPRAYRDGRCRPHHAAVLRATRRAA